MPIEDFIITVYCLIDDQLQDVLNGHSLRTRGFKPTLSDAEVLTMEIVGEYLGMDCDKAIWRYFKIHWSHFFQMVDRSNFVRQAANLWQVKSLLQRQISTILGATADSLHTIDGFPIPVRAFTRARFGRTFKGDAAYGHCDTKKVRYYGFRGHLVISSIGMVTAATFTAANVDERDVCPELVSQLRGLLLGDKGYMRPLMKHELGHQGLYLETPVRDNMAENRPKSFLRWMKAKRRLIETVIGQLAQRFHIEKVWARDKWHQSSRFWRKLLAHTVCVALNIRLGRHPLHLDGLVTC